MQNNVDSILVGLYDKTYEDVQSLMLLTIELIQRAERIPKINGSAKKLLVTTAIQVFLGNISNTKHKLMYDDFIKTLPITIDILVSKNIELAGLVRSCCYIM